MSGVIASIVTFKLNARLQRRDFMRAKIEELYTHLHLYCNLLRGEFFPYISVFLEKIDINQANELRIKNLTGKDGEDFRKVEMLVGVYFARLDGQFQMLLDCRRQLNNIVFQYRNRLDAGETDGRDLQPYLQAELSKLSRTEESFKKALLAEARRFL
jgi:hypothetical protein